MIVRYLGDRIQLITQPSHAHLARAIMERCAPLADHPRRTTILHAIAEHDNGWAEEDASPAVDPRDGRIYDFVGAPLAVRHGVWPRAVERLKDDPWAAALVAQHAVTVYGRFRSDADWTAFFALMEAKRDEMVSASGLSAADVPGDYRFLRLADLISLVFCTSADGPQQYTDWTVERSGTRIIVTPDAFGGAVIPFDIAAADIPRRAFASNDELRAALATADTTVLKGEVAAVP